MKDAETELGGLAGQFPSTAWTLLRNARTQGPRARAEALQPLVEIYWKPVYFLIRHAWKKSNEEAKDLTQEFFLRMVLEAGLLEKYVPARGGFRPFLKASVLNFLRDDAKTAGAQKRGGGALHLRFPAEGDGDVEIPEAASMGPEQLFDAAWKQTVLSRAVARVSERLRAAGKEKALEAFRLYDLEPEGPGVSYESVSAKLGMTREAVKEALKLARAELRAAVLDVVAEGAESQEDLYRDVEELLGG